MVMANKRGTDSFVTSIDHDDPQSSYENEPDSPLSGDDLGTTTNIKKRRSIKKRVVLVKIGDADGSRSKGEAYPPSDSWAWRKYGQKPIKGSPHPRGYYRCSSFKGCPAKKQVERNRLDSTTLIITYAYEHNHPLPTSKHHHHNHNHQLQAAADKTPTPSTTTATPSATTTTISTDDSTDNGDPSSPLVDQVVNPFGDQSPTRLEFVGDSSILENLGVDYSWISDISFDETPSSLMGPTCDDGDVAVFSIKEEDESLFGDLGELPECSVVFQRIGR